MRPPSDESPDPRSHAARILVRPYPHHCPSRGSQTLVGIGVSALVGLDLSAPPRRVRLRPRSVLRAAVPETPVYEDGDTPAWKSDISAAAQTGKRIVDAEAKASPVKQRADSKFWCGVALALMLHAAQRVCGRGRGTAPRHWPMLDLSRLSDVAEFAVVLVCNSRDHRVVMQYVAGRGCGRAGHQRDGGDVVVWRVHNQQTKPVVSRAVGSTPSRDFAHLVNDTR